MVCPTTVENCNDANDGLGFKSNLSRTKCPFHSSTWGKKYASLNQLLFWCAYIGWLLYCMQCNLLHIKNKSLTPNWFEIRTSWNTSSIITILSIVLGRRNELKWTHLPRLLNVKSEALVLNFMLVFILSSYYPTINMIFIPSHFMFDKDSVVS